MTESNLKSLVGQFAAEGEFHTAAPYGQGHINSTFLVETAKHRYILQRINHHVFHEPEHVMHNIVLVTEYLRERIVAMGGDPLRETLTVIPAKDGKSFVHTQEDEYYRMYRFIEGAQAYQTVERPEHFYNAARAFGRFQNMLADFPAAELYETIPRFHDTPNRYTLLRQAIADDKAGRAADAKAEIAFALEREQGADEISGAIARGDIPLRVTHNDTKFNNIMIDDKTGEGICVIDLDTVMPGSLLYDYGDSIRFGASTAAEDETDLSKVEMDLALFEQFTRGFLCEMHQSMTPEEQRLLPAAARMMTLECGVRFLTDYLDGDVYFKTHRPGHNLDRARNQFKLVADMEQKHGRMMDIVAQAAELPVR